MRDYVICTESSCDVSGDVLAQWDVDCHMLSYTFDGDPNEYQEGSLRSKEFYDKMRAGGIVRTAAANVEEFRACFEKHIRMGRDVLYMGVSSSFSGTYQSAVVAGKMLEEQYPGRKVICVDSRCASAGQALLLYLTAKHRKLGASFEEAASFAEKIKLSISQWLTVEDLMYLKRGGRLNSKEAIVGKVLGVKPLLHISDEAKFEVAGKVRGRKKALTALAEKFLETVKSEEGEDFFIFHSDCVADAQTIARLVKERRPTVNVLFSNISACIGAHFGPGALCCAFVGTKR